MSTRPTGVPHGFGDAPGPERRRAVLVLAGVTALVVVLLVGLVAFLVGLGPDAGEGQSAPSGEAAAQPAPGQQQPDGDWDVAAQTDLATRPMLQLPESAALPHALTDDVAGPAITLPEPTVTSGTLVPGGFPASAEGAIAQLVELTRVGLEGGDPDAYALAYDSVAADGAPPARSAPLYNALQSTRARAGLAPSGAVPGLTFTWSPASALVKGSTDDGRYVVVCVLGELTAGINGQSISGGSADCQAMRRLGEEWRISPGAAAASPAPAWPGTAEAVRAGFRDLR